MHLQVKLLLEHWEIMNQLFQGIEISDGEGGLKKQIMI